MFFSPSIELTKFHKLLNFRNVDSEESNLILSVAVTALNVYPSSEWQSSPVVK